MKAGDAHQVRIALLATVLVLAGSCRCTPAPFTAVDPGFRVESETLAFGRVLENTTATKSVTLVAESHSSVHVTVTTSDAFTAPTEVDIPGSGTVDVPVTFRAGNGPSSGVLRLTGPGPVVGVALSGLGVRPLVCVPSAACHRSDYDFDSDRCVETTLADDTECDTGNTCLVQGRCRAAACVGVSRSCDDGNVCTVDACAATSGCVHAQRVCPTPTNPCMVPVCDPAQGCQETPAQDFLPCGPVDCVTANLCVRGACVPLPTPEGVECAPRIACRPRSECHQQACVPMDAGSWDVTWRSPLPYRVSAPRPPLLAFQGNLYLTACGLPEAPDAGAPDAGAPDAGAPDAGARDGGVDDAGSGDGGVPDDVTCGLVSYTGTGYERFAMRSPDGREGRLVNASASGIAVAISGGVELRSRATGARLAVFEGAQSLTVPGDGTFVGPRSAPDGGSELVVWSLDGGVQGEPIAWEPGALVATDEARRLWALEPDSGTLSWRVRTPDGGVASSSLAVPPGTASLAVSSGSALLGGHLLVTLAVDGGAALFEVLDAGAATPLAREQLLGLGLGLVFHRRCPGLSSCLQDEEATFAQAVDLASGAQAWDAEVMPGSTGATLLDLALVDRLPGAVAMVTRAEVDGGPRAALVVWANGKQLLSCPLPAEAQDARAAVLSPGQLTVLSTRPDGGVTLRALPLDGLPLLQQGWTQPEGVGGTRRAMP